VALAVAANHGVREHDEFYQDPDDLDRLRAALSNVPESDDPVLHVEAQVVEMFDGP